MMSRLEVSRSTVFVLLDDLRSLGFLEDGSKTGFKGTRKRKLNVAAILKAVETPSQTSEIDGSKVRHSRNNSPALTKMGSEIGANPGHNRPLPSIQTDHLTEESTNREQEQGLSADAKTKTTSAERLLSFTSSDEEIVPLESFRMLKQMLDEMGIDSTDKQNLGRLRAVWRRTSIYSTPKQRVEHIREIIREAANYEDGDPVGIFACACKMLEGDWPF